MATFLFDDIIFGPVWSRRLGESLGINLLPKNRKICNFNCVYCECGLTPSGNAFTGFPGFSEVRERLKDKLQQMQSKGEYLNSITFAGNGEPTLHPEFPRIMDDAIGLRDKYFPNADIAVLSNATMITNKNIFTALQKADMNILKLDSVIEETLHKINCPKSNFSLNNMLDAMKLFAGKMIIQTLFFRGSYNGLLVDNTTEDEVGSWLSVLDVLRPQYVMLYSIARDTAIKGIQGIGQQELEEIARRVGLLGIRTQVTP